MYEQTPDALHRVQGQGLQGSDQWPKAASRDHCRLRAAPYPSKPMEEPTAGVSSDLTPRAMNSHAKDENQDKDAELFQQHW
jgi:hypothetical protein